MQMHPGGFNMAMNSHNFIMGIFCLPFKNNMLGLNVGLLVSFILSGLGAALLCYRFVPNYPAALLAGFIFAFSPWKMIKLQDHHWFALTATIPFYIYHFIDVLEYGANRFLPRIKSYTKLIYCLLLGLLTSLSEYYLTFFLLYFSGFYILVKFYLKPWKFNYKSLKTWVIIAAIVVAGSVLVSLLAQWGVDDKGAIYWGGDLAAYFMPVYQQWVKDAINAADFIISPHAENYFFLGFAFIILVLITFLIARKRGKFTLSDETRNLAWIALLFLLLTLPVLRVLGHFFFYLPTAIIHYIPFANNVRVITRIFLLFSLLFPVVVLYVFNLQQLKYKNIILFSVIVILLIEFYPKQYDFIDTAQIPASVYKLKETGGRVVLPIPAGIRDGFIQKGLNNSDILFYQTIFDKKIIGGYTARLSEKVLNEHLNDSVMRDIFTLSENPDTTLQPRSEAEILQFFNKFSPDIIYIHPKWNTPQVQAYINRLAAKRAVKVRDM